MCFFCHAFHCPLCCGSFGNCITLKLRGGWEANKRSLARREGQRRSAFLRRYHLKILGASKLTRNSKDVGEMHLAVVETPESDIPRVATDQQVTFQISELFSFHQIYCFFFGRALLEILKGTWRKDILLFDCAFIF